MELSNLDYVLEPSDTTRSPSGVLWLTMGTGVFSESPATVDPFTGYDYLPSFDEAILSEVTGFFNGRLSRLGPQIETLKAILLRVNAQLMRQVISPDLKRYRFFRG